MGLVQLRNCVFNHFILVNLNVSGHTWLVAQTDSAAVSCATQFFGERVGDVLTPHSQDCCED